MAVAGAAALVAALFAVAQPPAEAASCPDAAGKRIARPGALSGDFTFVGGGFGHGVGMSQYGAKGAAELGCSTSQILSTYYPGAAISANSVPGSRDDIRVSLVPSAPGGALPATVKVTAVSDSIAWRLGGATATQARDTTWTVSVAAGLLVVKQGTTIRLGPGTGRVRVALRGKVVRLPAKNSRYNRGVLELSQPRSGRIGVVAAIPTLDKYLYGLAEMPASWPLAALRAQAVAGRSFAARKTATLRSECRCHVYDSVVDQAYHAYEHESVAPRWVDAVNQTSGTTLRSGGDYAQAFYHSSSGGHTESAKFVFGGDLPYSTAVNDSSWERASSNPSSTWAFSISATDLGALTGVGRATEVQLPAPKGAIGRVGDPRFGYGGVVVTGTEGTKTYSGPAFRSLISARYGYTAFRSALFDVYPRPVGGIPVTGDWNGDGVDTPGWFLDGVWYQRNANSTGGSWRIFRFGRAGDRPLVGDWDGRGPDTVGVRRARTFLLRNRNSAGPAHSRFRFGPLGGTPVAGDWNRDGRYGVGVVSGRRWHLRNALSAGSADRTFDYGRATSRPVVGDWTGNGRDGVGRVRGATWALRNRLSAGPAEIRFDFGKNGRPVTGNWLGGLRADGVGRVSGQTWRLRDSLSTGGADKMFAYGG
ncbi:MAG: SpoIID/LytB domain-containing protein [Euzebyales bacterium]|nr:SpoIID/LytB domain-containing protein [Euzebyales bacterium]MBA3620719.1 SpoIID/LytB domain-containing protein [Euzebyales bacterium]